MIEIYHKVTDYFPHAKLSLEFVAEPDDAVRASCLDDTAAGGVAGAEPAVPGVVCVTDHRVTEITEKRKERKHGETATMSPFLDGGQR